MDEQKPLAATLPSSPDAKPQVILGGLFAGFGLSLAVAFLMHVVQEASPNGFGMNIDGSVLLVIFVAGPIFGLGLAMAVIALIPVTGSGASAGQAKRGDDPAGAHAGDGAG